MSITAFADMVRALSATTSSNDKLAILKANATDLNLKLLQETYSVFRPFYLKDIAMPTSYATLDAEPEYFLGLLDYLHLSRAASTATRQQATGVLGMYTEQTAQILAKVIQKDLKAGITATTVNKAVPGTIEVFKVMLSGKVESSADLDRLIYPVQCEYKYDGERSALFNAELEQLPFSRNGLLQEEYLGKFDEELAAIRKHLGFEVVVDHEVVATSFQEVAKSKGSKNVEAQKNLRMVVFDLIPLDKWKAGKFDIAQEARTALVQDMVQRLNMPRLTASTVRVCETKEEVAAFFEEAVGAGLEGIMIKELYAEYQWKRSNYWLKWKPTNKVDAVIVDIYPGKKGTKYEGRTGGIRMEGTDENGKPFRVGMGSGINEKFRKELDERPQDFLNHHIELKYDCFTLAEGATVHSLRFPRVSRMRPDLD